MKLSQVRELLKHAKETVDDITIKYDRPMTKRQRGDLEQFIGLYGFMRAMPRDAINVLPHALLYIYLSGQQIKAILQHHPYKELMHGYGKKLDDQFFGTSDVPNRGR
jgi:hypothetical protein